VSIVFLYEIVMTWRRTFLRNRLFLIRTHSHCFSFYLTTINLYACVNNMHNALTDYVVWEGTWRAQVQSSAVLLYWIMVKKTKKANLAPTWKRLHSHGISIRRRNPSKTQQLLEAWKSKRTFFETSLLGIEDVRLTRLVDNVKLLEASWRSKRNNFEIPSCISSSTCILVTLKMNKMFIDTYLMHSWRLKVVGSSSPGSCFLLSMDNK
jgi:hypothetical protein